MGGGAYLFPRAVVANYQKLGVLKIQQFSYTSESRQSEIKMSSRPYLLLRF